MFDGYSILSLYSTIKKYSKILNMIRTRCGEVQLTGKVLKMLHPLKGQKKTPKNDCIELL